MKIDLKFWVIIALSVVIILFIIFWPKKPDSTVIVKANDSIETINEQNRILAMSVRTLELDLQHTKNWAKIDSARFVREITVKNQQLAKKRVRIDTVFKDNEVVQDYLQTADSVFAMMRERIDTLEAQAVFKEGLYSQMIYIKDKQIGNLEIVSSQKDIIIADQAKQLKKKSPKRLGNILKEVGKDVGFFLIGFGIGKGS